MEEKALLLFGYFGFGNLGDEETLRIFTARLRARGISYRVLSDDKESSVGKWTVGRRTRGEKSAGGTALVLPFSRRKVLALFQKIRACRCVVLVGGNLLQSESSFSSLLFYTLLLRYAARAGKPLMLYGGGIGGFRGRLSCKTARKALDGFSRLGARTAGDLAALRTMFPEGKDLRFVPDLCFSLPEKQAKKENLLLLIPRKSSVGDPWLGELILSAHAMGWKVVIAAFHPKEDGAALSRLAARCGVGFFAPRTYEEFSRVCASARFSVSERFHGGVFSLLCHTPCFLHDASDKCRRLCETVGAFMPDGGLLRLFRSYREVTERIRDVYASEQAKGAGAGRPPGAEGVIEEGLATADKKETGDGISGFSHVISLFRKTEEERFDEWVQKLSDE